MEKRFKYFNQFLKACERLRLNNKPYYTYYFDNCYYLVF